MPAKAVLLILFAGLTACGLVVMRQQRIHNAHEIASLHRDLAQRRREVRDMHVFLQDRLRLDHIRALVAQYEQESGIKMVPFRAEECILRCNPRTP